MPRPRANTTLSFLHGIDQVSEYCIEAQPDVSQPSGWTFVIVTQRRYRPGDECWLENKRQERIDARVTRVTPLGEFFKVEIRTVIPREWEKS